MIAFLVTAVLLLGAQVGLARMSVPAFASSREMIRELDPLLLERFTAPAPSEESGEPAEEEATDDDATEEVVAVPSFEQEVGTAMEELERRFSEEPVVTPDADRAADAAAPATGIAADAADERFESLFGAAAEIVVGRATRGRTPSDGGGLGIGITERAADAEAGAGARGAGGSQPGVTVETAAGRNRAAGEEVEIGDVESETFDGSEAELLAVWMRANPSELPIGVRVHVNFQPSFLTAAARFTSDGRAWELFLMLNETLQELHIVLIEGERSVYLIDRGFQELSRSLREGTVRRDNGRIVAIDSRTGAASGDRAQDFYNVFLSWWDVVKADVRTQ